MSFNCLLLGIYFYYYFSYEITTLAEKTRVLAIPFLPPLNPGPSNDPIDILRDGVQDEDLGEFVKKNNVKRQLEFKDLILFRSKMETG